MPVGGIIGGRTAEDASPGPEDASPGPEDASPGPEDASPGPEDAKAGTAVLGAAGTIIPGTGALGMTPGVEIYPGIHCPLPAGSSLVPGGQLIGPDTVKPGARATAALGVAGVCTCAILGPDGSQGTAPLIGCDEVLILSI